MPKERLEVVSRHLSSGKMEIRPPITAHILDTSKGTPADNVQLQLFQLINGRWTHLITGKTDANGRCNDLYLGKSMEKGQFKIFVDIGQYFKRNNQTSFYPYIEVVFEIADPNQHYHIPLLLSPYSYTTYRGS